MNSQKANAAPRFVSYLEGVRGLAAFYVVLFHIHDHLELNNASFGSTTAVMPFGGAYFLLGHYAVSVFIVISGFVLTIPVASRGALNGGWMRFFQRRARRLLPAYYAALVLSIPFYLVSIHQDGGSTSWRAVLAQLGVHFLFLQNFSDRTIFALNGAAWSVAVEVQIYIVFVFLLLPLMRRFGIIASIVVAFAIGLAPTVHGLLHHQISYQFEASCFWYLGLFAVGSGAAFIAYDSADRFAGLRDRIPWKLVSVAFTVAFLVLVVQHYDERYVGPYLPLLDTLSGLAVAAGFIAIAKTQIAGKTSFVAAFFSWKPFVWLGTFAYSLYLLNFPIISVVMHALFLKPPIQKVLIGYGVVVPGVVILSYFFGRVFETPFVSAVRRQADQAVLHDDAAAVAAIEHPTISDVANGFDDHPRLDKIF